MPLRHILFLAFRWFLWHKGADKRSFPCMEATYHAIAITTQRKAQNVCLEVCCYGIDFGTSIVRLNQSEESIWRFWTNESAGHCLVDITGLTVPRSPAGSPFLPRRSSLSPGGRLGRRASLVPSLVVEPPADMMVEHVSQLRHLSSICLGSGGGDDGGDDSGVYDDWWW